MKDKKSFKDKKKLTKENNFSKSENIKSKRKRESLIPKPVANRMARRVIFTTGVPTFLGMGVFVLSYIVIVKGIAEIPPSLTLTSSAICFSVGLLGLRYGILSASWEDSPGSLLGFEHIGPNIQRMRSAFKKVSPSE